jgi:tRNA 2-thiouridine synthesizing protein A
MTGPKPPPAVIDGGDRSCVRLLLELRDRVARLPAGTVIHLIATDPAAPLDLAAWCHLTGHIYLGPLPRHGQRPAYALRVSPQARPVAPKSPWRIQR